MPRKLQDTKLDKWTAREKLHVRREPYWRTIQEGHAIGYRRLPGEKAGSWVARYYDPVTRRRTYQALGTADDRAKADGATTLDFAQAQDEARKWFAALARSGGNVVEPMTVRQAMDAYLADYVSRRGKDERWVRNTSNAHILPPLGSRLLTDLTHGVLRKWHQALAAAPAKMRTGAKAKQANVRKTQTDDGRRARQATANRVLTVLKAALNLAYREGYAPSDDAWRRVKPFGKVDAPKIRYLNDAEAVRLVNRCGPDLRNLVTAALLTGCRYGELTRLASSDFDKGAGLIHIRETKSGKPRTVPLTEEGRAFFTGMGAGKVGAALLLTRDGMAWGDGHQHRPLAEACREAKIEPVISFHILRHSAASRLVQRGVPMAVIAKLLGNSEAICAKHYAHLSQDYVNETIRSAGGAIGIFAETNVIPLHAAG